VVKKGWQHQTHRRAALIFDQLAKTRHLAEEAVRHGWPDAPKNVDEFLDDVPYMGMLDKLYGEDYQLSLLMDRSDLIFHAEGPATSGEMPRLKAVNWLCSGVDRNLRRLAEAVLQMRFDAADKVASDIDLRLTGMAPGSLYMGFAIAPPSKALNGLPYGEEEPAFTLIRDAICGLPTIPQFIRDEDIDDDILTVMPDPALRDASLTASFHLAPTGKVGIHTLEISRPNAVPAVLSQRERVVLRDVTIKRPLMRNKNSGIFVGELREVDLDANRFHLRNIPDIGSLRCVMRLSIDEARKLIGSGVKIKGIYEADNNGKPRLMQVESMEPYQVQTNIYAG
jgi:hypothetical protein